MPKITLILTLTTIFSGSAVVLHHELTLPVGRLRSSRKVNVHAPVRKIVHCRTHDLQQSLLAKLGRATQNLQAIQGSGAVMHAIEERPFEVVSANSFCVPGVHQVLERQAETYPLHIE